MALYLLANGQMQTTAPFVAVTTSTSMKTMLQIQLGNSIVGKVKEWGISFDGSAAATPIKVELIETDVNATVTAAVTTDITKIDGNALAGGDPVTNLIQVGTGATGYTATAEGSITVVRNLDGPKFVAPTNQYEKQFPLGNEPLIRVGKFGRIRVTAGAAVNCYCYLIIEI